MCKALFKYSYMNVSPGHVQSKDSIAEVIRFAAEENLFLMVDEVAVFH